MSGILPHDAFGYGVADILGLGIGVVEADLDRIGHGPEEAGGSQFDDQHLRILAPLPEMDSEYILVENPALSVILVRAIGHPLVIHVDNGDVPVPPGVPQHLAELYRPPADRCQQNHPGNSVRRGGQKEGDELPPFEKQLDPDRQRADGEICRRGDETVERGPADHHVDRHDAPSPAAPWFTAPR